MMTSLSHHCDVVVVILASSPVTNSGPLSPVWIVTYNIAKYLASVITHCRGNAHTIKYNIITAKILYGRLPTWKFHHLIRMSPVRALFASILVDKAISIKRLIDDATFFS